MTPENSDVRGYFFAAIHPPADGCPKANKQLAEAVVPRLDQVGQIAAEHDVIVEEAEVCPPDHTIFGEATAFAPEDVRQVMQTILPDQEVFVDARESADAGSAWDYAQQHVPGLKPADRMPLSGLAPMLREVHGLS